MLLRPATRGKARAGVAPNPHMMTDVQISAKLSEEQSEEVAL